MASEVSIVLHEDNDETLLLTIVPTTSDGDLSGVTEIQVLLKPSSCTSDSDPTVLVLSSTDPAEVQVTSFSATEIIARAFIPASALALPYDRWWRADALAGTARRTAMYGPVTMVDL